MLLLLTWVVVFALIALPMVAAHAWLVNRGESDERVLIAGPLVFVGLLAVLTFAAFFAGDIIGVVFSISGTVGLGWFLAVNRRRAAGGEPSEGRPTSALLVPALLLFAVGLFYLALLFLPKLGREPEWQSQVRFLYEFPPDANLPKMLGDRLYAGESPKPFLPEAGWLSSDRPPLQSGFYLMVRPWLTLLHLPAGLGYQCVGTLVQLFWLPAIWLVCRRLAVSPRFSTGVILLAAASGFLLFNSTYVWPKLLSGGYVLLAAVLLLDRIDPRTRLTATLGGAAAALGWLAHGGAAFSLVTLGAVLLLPLWYPGRKKLLLSAAAFAVLALPWTAYQKFYDPPANRLLKWHLAGVVPIDSRTTWEAIHDSYGGLSRAALIDTKLANFRTLFHGSYAPAVDVFTTSLQKRRVDEFFYVFRSLGILNLAWILAPLTWLFRRRLPPYFELQGVLAMWTVLTLVGWSLLMFVPGSTILHQGPYAMMLSLFLLAIVFLAQLPRWLGRPVLAWHAISFSLTWLPYYKSAPLDPWMFVLLGLAVAVIAWALLKGAASHASNAARSSEFFARKS